VLTTLVRCMELTAPTAQVARGPMQTMPAAPRRLRVQLDIIVPPAGQ